MSDEAYDKPAKRAASKPRASNPRSRQTDKVKAAAATAGIGKATRVSVPVVPDTSAASAALSRRASAVRLGLLTTTLAVIVGSFAWFTEAPLPSTSQAIQASAAGSGPSDPLAPHVRESLDQELRLAALALDIQQSHESLARLAEDARALSQSVGALASGVDRLKSDVRTARIDASAGVARLEEQLHEIKMAALSGPTELGDPAISELVRLGDPELAEAATQIAETDELMELGDPALRERAWPSYAESAETVQPATTGGLPGTEAAPQATVKVAFNKPKTLPRAARAIRGWHVHSVRNDLVLVESAGAHYEVKTGELLPGAGVVRGVKKRGEQWVVLTSRGVITEAR